MPEPVELPEAGDAGTLVAPPPNMRWVCKRMGYGDEGGCTASGGAPAVVVALATLGLASRRARRVRR